MKWLKIKYKLLVLILLFFPFGMDAQGFLRANGKKIVNGNGEEVLLRGIGLGGWMLQEGYMMQTQDFANTQHELKKKISDLIGITGMEAFYEAWLSNHVREIDIDSIAAWGFNSIRLPMHYNLYTLPIEEEPVAGHITWLQRGFELTDSLLKWCKKNQVYLILDLHAAPGGQGKDAAISDYDPAKPSLWESTHNWKKTVALWKKLAERYANEEWIGGYDLINETNWDLPNNTMLKNLYREITDSIRSVDQNHILFIEGNWFANDFTGLTPPWDTNMAYSFHKYWTYNNPSSIQWIINLRNTHNVPVWLGESGENSNTWFRECIQLLEENNIGWAWWPLKKIGSIAGPLSAIKTDEYQVLLNYWKGQGTKPDMAYATNALMQMAENMKLENCEFHPDVIDAMFRQAYSTESKPYTNATVPGVIPSTDFDLGANGSAYYDTDVANYHLSTNTYTAWNQGWSYRNDGVDIEPCNDQSAINGYQVSFTRNNEWLQYTLNVAKTAVYEVNVKTASNNSNGVFHFTEDGAGISPNIQVPSTSGWQNWQTISVPDVILREGIHKFRFCIDTGYFNFSQIEFIETGELSSIPTKFISAETDADASTIHISINKPLSVGIPESLSDFKVMINGTEIGVVNVEANSVNSRLIDLVIGYSMLAGNDITISYTGNTIMAMDGTYLETFSDKIVINSLIPRHKVPGKIQAENYYYNNGLDSETCTDTGGGIDLGWTDSGDYLDYLVYVPNSGTYAVEYRVASQSATGQIELLALSSDTTFLHLVDLPVTGGWQTWSSVSGDVYLPSGQYKIRLLVKVPGFNINWIRFSLVTSSGYSEKETDDMIIRPNPAIDFIYCNAKNFVPDSFEILNLMGQSVLQGILSDFYDNRKIIHVGGLKNGIYILKLRNKESVVSRKFVIDRN